MRIGNIGLAFHPAELYSYYGLAIRRDSPFADTIVVGYADGIIGYLADPLCLRGGRIRSHYRAEDPGFSSVHAGSCRADERCDCGSSEANGRVAPNSAPRQSNYSDLSYFPPSGLSTSHSSLDIAPPMTGSFIKS